jgi:hypothetical protein
METYYINITGSGTAKEIIDSLRELVNSIENTPIELMDCSEFEDKILMSSIISETVIN